MTTTPLPLPMTIDKVSLLASVYPNKAEWQRITYDGANLLIPPDLFAKVTAIDPNATMLTSLYAYSAAKRFNKETGGIAVDGVSVSTDRESQGMLNGAFAMASNNAAFTTQWKVNDTTFVTLTAAQIIGIAVAVGQWVAQCFSIEATVAAAITAGTTTTYTQIDASYA